MFLKKNRRRKNGRTFTYYNIVENKRCAGGKTVQRQVLYLGELNGSQLEAWRKSIEVFDEDENTQTELALYPESESPGTIDPNTTVEIKLGALTLHHPRQWGACWIALHFWDLLQLDDFFTARLGVSRKGTDWVAVLKVLVCYRLIDPGSEWRLHRDWFQNSAMADLLGGDFTLAQKDTLYRCHDRLLEHKSALFNHLQQRWNDLFGAKFEILLYDLTSTYFECDSTRRETGGKRQFGYSRDKRSDCLQVVIALVVTPEGLPVAYEVMPGNTLDNSTLRDFLEKIQTQYGKAERVWVMDRGIPTEEVLAEMRTSDPPVRYLVGTPKGRLTKLEKEFLEHPWEEVREGVKVKLRQVNENREDDPGKTSGDELYILARSENRVHKERSMRQRRLRKLWNRLGEIKAMKKLTHKECLMKLGAARKEAGRAWQLVEVNTAGESEPATDFTYRLKRDAIRKVYHRKGRYLLRSNLDSAKTTPSELWQYYIQLVEIEEAFRNLKGDLSIRPVHHRTEERIEAHIFISFLSYCLHVTMRQQLKAHATGLTPRELLMKFSAMQMLDVHLPTTDGRTIAMSRYTQPNNDQKLLLSRLKLTLPPQAPPKIYSK